MTIDHIGGGRLDLGIGAGAGGASWDARVLGDVAVSQADRTARFVEFVDVLDLLLRDPSASHNGRFYEVVDSRTYPGCTQSPRVPFTIAGTGPKALGVVARHGAGWVTYGGLGTTHTHDEWYLAVRDQVDTLERVCVEADRDPVDVRRVALVSLEANWAHGTLAAWDDFVGLATDLGFDEIAVHWPRPDDAALPGVAPDVFDVICDRVRSGDYS
jgi:alkanesulfonate monooxygenase SsuD/methylene tetrahydromethanopterin reductase-like flavin-dependent oxidoreductase (luciferase family)